MSSLGLLEGAASAGWVVAFVRVAEARSKGPPADLRPSPGLEGRTTWLA